MTSWLDNYHDAMHRKRIMKDEEQCVDLLLGHYKLDGVMRQKILQDYKCSRGMWALTFESFNQVVSDFPVQLVMSHTKSIANAHPLSKLLGNFAALPMISEYSDARYSFALNAQIALVIKWPYFRGALVLHELTSSPAIGPRLEFPSTSDCGSLTLQPLRDFLTGLEWGPESRYEGVRNDEKI